MIKKLCELIDRKKCALREKCPYSEIFWSVSFRIRTIRTTHRNFFYAVVVSLIFIIHQSHRFSLSLHKNEIFIRISAINVTKSTGSFLCSGSWTSDTHIQNLNFRKTWSFTLFYKRIKQREPLNHGSINVLKS